MNNLRCALDTIGTVAAMLSPDQPKTPREIWREMPETAPSSVRAALLILVRDGRAAFEGEMGRRRYRLSGGA